MEGGSVPLRAARRPAKSPSSDGLRAASGPDTDPCLKAGLFPSCGRLQLLLGQPPVQIVGGHQFLMGASAGDPSLLKAQDPVGFHTVDRRRAMIRVVRPFIRFFSACWTYISDSLSRLEAASSNRRIRGFRRKARAMAIRCLCPPDSYPPLSTSVSYPAGSFSMNSAALASRAAFRISSSPASLPRP